MKPKISITDNKALISKIKNIKGKYVKVGLFGEQDSQLVIIGATNEFGTDRAGRNHNITIPERSYIRSTYDEEIDKITETINKSKIDIVLGKLSSFKILSRIGLYFQGRVRNKIESSLSWAEKNAESTLKRKAPFTKPLFAGEDRIKKAITYIVKD